MKRLADTDALRDTHDKAAQESIEFAIGGILDVAKRVEQGFRDSQPGAREKEADSLRYFAGVLQDVANRERRNGR